MDNIKILAAALALAGCMENGMGMEIKNVEPIECQGDKIIVREINLDAIDQLAKRNDYNSVIFDTVSFNQTIEESQSVYRLINDIEYLEFNNCKNLPKPYGASVVECVSFIHGNYSLEDASFFCCATGVQEYLEIVHYYNVSSLAKKGTHSNLLEHIGIHLQVTVE